MESKELALVCRRRWDVEVKCWFNTSGSALMACGAGLRIRCMVFHSSFGLLEDKAFLWKERFTFLVSDLVSHFAVFVPDTS